MEEKFKLLEERIAVLEKQLSGENFMNHLKERAKLSR